MNRSGKGPVLDAKVGQVKPEEFKSQMNEPMAANKVTSLKVSKQNSKFVEF